MFPVLHASTSEKVPLDWTEEMERAFCFLEEVLTTPIPF